MDQLKQIRQLIARLSLRQRIAIGVAVLLVAGGLVFFVRWKKEKDYKPLFTNLAAEDAGQVVAKVKEAGVDYRLGDNGTSVLVPSAKIAELRLELASAGVPKSGRIGYELFDRTNFGATDFAEQVNYHRALEGELERSVMSLGAVEQARVHLTFPKDSIYTENRQPAKASVMVKLREGAKLSPQNVEAISKLAASAVEGLAPEGVSVLDMKGNLLLPPKKKGLPDGTDLDDNGLDYKRKIERDLLAKLGATLDPLIGAQKYRTAVTVDCDFSSGDQSEESFDPAKSVMVTSSRIEDGANGLVTSGVPGAASNLPRPTSRPASGVAGNTRRSENITYQSSRVVRHTKVPQGAIRRVSVGIVLDHTVRYEKGQPVIEPPTPETIKTVKDVASAIIGAQPERGDQVIVESAPFEATLALKLPPAPPPAAAPSATPGGQPGANPAQPGKWWSKYLAMLTDFIKKGNPKVMAGAGAGILLVIAAGVFFFLKLRKKRAKAKAEAAAQLAAGGGEQRGIEGPDIQKEFEAKVAEQNALKEQATRDALNALKVPQAKTKKAEVLARHISEEAKKDPVSMAQVVRSWLNE